MHIEPMKDHLRIRFLQDGVLANHKDFPKDLIPPLTSRISIMASGDNAEKRRQRDGRILFDCKGLPFDIRVSTVTIHGEPIVMRLLRSRTVAFTTPDANHRVPRPWSNLFESYRANRWLPRPT